MGAIQCKTVGEIIVVWKFGCMRRKFMTFDKTSFVKALPYKIVVLIISLKKEDVSTMSILHRQTTRNSFQ